MQKQLIFGVVGLIAGLAIGFFGANSLNRRATSSASNSNVASMEAPPLPGQQTSAPQGGMQPEVAAALDKAKNERNNFDAQIKAGQMYAQIGNLDKAREYFDKAAPLAPNTFEGSVNVANAYFDTKQFELAQKFYEKALTINPNDIDARTDLGTTYIESPNPDFERGIANFNESLKMDPKHEPTLFNLAIAYYRKGDMDNAKKTADRLEEVDPSSPLNARLKQRLTSK
ncbi:MAG: tetratricopeptide repeat protein [Pyrinomonadaceae bacterium]